MAVTRFTPCLVFAILVACGSGEPAPTSPSAAAAYDPPAPAGSGRLIHFEGVWQGSITPDGASTASPAIVIVNGWGEFRLLSDDVQFIGFLQRTQAGFNGDLLGIREAGATWRDGTRVSTFAVSGDFGVDESIEATYAGEAESGVISLAWVSSDESGSIENAGGMWAQLDDNRNPVAVFELHVRGDWDALVTGTDVNGCLYSGAMESWTSFRSYEIGELIVENCPLVGGVDINGVYQGSAVLIDVAGDNTDELAMVIGLSNGEAQLTHVLYRL